MVRKLLFVFFLNQIGNIDGHSIDFVTLPVHLGELDPDELEGLGLMGGGPDLFLGHVSAQLGPFTTLRETIGAHQSKI